MSTTMETKDTYNGWTNYETWNCKFWIDNDQGSQEYWRGQAIEAKEHPMENEYMALDRRIVHALAERLKAEFEEQAEEWMGNQASFFADIFNAGLSRVNWHEIAESLLEEIEE